MGLYDNIERMWFGTEQKMGWVETPQTGADVSSLGMSSDSTLQNGGGNVRNSWDSHKTYQFSWGNSAPPSLVSLIQAYRNGSYGRGFLYFHDPMHYTTNLLPKRWADPSMAVNYEAEPLIPDVNPTAVPVVSTDNNYPVNAANYALPANYSSQATSTEHYIPIPDGYSLAIGAVYEGPGEVYVRTNAGTSMVIPMSASQGSVTNTIITGQPWARIGIRNPSASVTQSITLTGMTARLSETIPDGGITYTNLAINPSFEGVSGSVELVRNLHQNPRLTSGSNGWYVSSGSTRAAVSIPGRPEFSVAWWSGGPIGVVINRVSAATLTGLTIGSTYTANIMVLVDSPGWRFGIWDTVLTSPSPHLMSRAISGSPEWREESITFVASTTEASIGLRATENATGTYGLVGATVVEGSAVPEIFDGSHSPDPDFVPAWTGPVGASPSTISGEVPTAVTGTNVAAYSFRSGMWASSGSHSVRVIPRTTTNTATYASLSLTGATIGQTYTLMVKAYLPAAQAGTIHGNARRFYTGWEPSNFDVAPNEAGVHSLRIVVTATSTATTVILYNGSPVQDIWWDSFMAVEGDYTGPYFDGFTDGAGWNGAENNSTSSFAMPIQGPVGEGPWYSGEGHSGCRFVGNPTVVNYNGVGGGQIGLSAIFTEVGAWE